MLYYLIKNDYLLVNISMKMDKETETVYSRSNQLDTTLQNFAPFWIPSTVAKEWMLRAPYVLFKSGLNLGLFYFK